MCSLGWSATSSDRWASYSRLTGRWALQDIVNAMPSWIWAVALALIIGSVSTRAWWVERRKRLVAERRVVERPNSFYASKAVHSQEDEEWWRRIELERLHELNREYVERLLRQIDASGVGTLSKDERAFMERMAKIDAPPRPGVRPPSDPWPSPA